MGGARYTGASRSADRGHTDPHLGPIGQAARRQERGKSTGASFQLHLRGRGGPLRVHLRAVHMHPGRPRWVDIRAEYGSQLSPTPLVRPPVDSDHPLLAGTRSIRSGVVRTGPHIGGIEAVVCIAAGACAVPRNSRTPKPRHLLRVPPTRGHGPHHILRQPHANAILNRAHQLRGHDRIRPPVKRRKVVDRGLWERPSMYCRARSATGARWATCGRKCDGRYHSV